MGSTFYVDGTNGNDANPGTLSQPWKTLHHAFAQLQDRYHNGVKSDKLIIRAGVYQSRDTYLWPNEGNYLIEMEGTETDWCVIQAMETTADDPNGRRALNGKYYEYVEFRSYFNKITNTWVLENASLNRWRVDITNFKTLKPLKPNQKDSKAIKKKLCMTNNYTMSLAMLLEGEHPASWRCDKADCVNPGDYHVDFDGGYLYYIPRNPGDNPNQLQLYHLPDYDLESYSLFIGHANYLRIEGIVATGIGKWLNLRNRTITSTQYVTVPHEPITPKWDNVHIEGCEVIHAWMGLFGQAVPVSNIWYRYCRFWNKLREVMQLSGPSCGVEYCEFIYPHARWQAFSYVSLVNPRVMPDFVFRGNIIWGLGTLRRPRRGGPVLIWELYKKHDKNGDNIIDWAAGTVENNLFVNFANIECMTLGTGEVMMRDLTVRNNVFLDGQYSAVLFNTPVRNLIFENNTFVNCKVVFDTFLEKGKYNQIGADWFSLTFRKNIFVDCQTVFDSKLLQGTHPQDNIVIDKNLFWNCGGTGGTNAIYANPQFKDRQKWDFRLRSNSPAILQGESDIGAYDTDAGPAQGTDWWNYDQQYFQDFYDTGIPNYAGGRAGSYTPPPPPPPPPSGGGQTYDPLDTHPDWTLLEGTATTGTCTYDSANDQFSLGNIPESGGQQAVYVNTKIGQVADTSITVNLAQHATPTATNSRVWSGWVLRANPNSYLLMRFIHNAQNKIKGVGVYQNNNGSWSTKINLNLANPLVNPSVTFSVSSGQVTVLVNDTGETQTANTVLTSGYTGIYADDTGPTPYLFQVPEWSAPETGQPPTCTAPDTESTTYGDPLTFDVAGTDPTGGSVTLTASNLPSGATFVDNGDNTGTFSWTPLAEQIGEYTVTFTATNANNQTATDETVITVQDKVVYPIHPDWQVVSGVTSGITVALPEFSITIPKRLQQQPAVALRMDVPVHADVQFGVALQNAPTVQVNSMPVIVRASDDGQDFIGLRLTQGNLELVESVGGALSVLTTASAPAMPADVTLDVQGNTAKILNTANTVLLSATVSVLAAGRIGVYQDYAADEIQVMWKSLRLI